MEPLKRYRTGRQQKLTLAQVPVNADGQAIAPYSVLDQKAGDAADIGAACHLVRDCDQSSPQRSP
ncbi:hypothetical protein A9Q95_05030 [Rhodobacterales bacterium 59_46_T64]|nr:hypothetical protein A9Q95_05030 [Rhodobacterales bacterium 59_46_T64]